MVSTTLIVMCEFIEFHLCFSIVNVGPTHVVVVGLVV